MDLIDFATTLDQFGVRFDSNEKFVGFYEAMRGLSVPLSLNEAVARDKDAVALYVEESKIRAIKHVRTLHGGVSLKEAKEAVETPEFLAAVDKFSLDALREKLIGSPVPYEEPVPHYESDPFDY